jgi:transcriptional regulator with XRE-family HTH domain
MGFGARLRQMRKDRGMTQEELTQKLRISPMTASRIEAGEGWPRYWDLLEISKIFSVSLDELVYGAAKEGS